MKTEEEAGRNPFKQGKGREKGPAHFFTEGEEMHQGGGNKGSLFLPGSRRERGEKRVQTRMVMEDQEGTDREETANSQRGKKRTFHLRGVRVG